MYIILLHVHCSTSNIYVFLTSVRITIKQLTTIFDQNECSDYHFGSVKQFVEVLETCYSLDS
jgi:hypothetical protein